MRWNRLQIVADNEGDFVSAVTEYFSQLLELPYENLELDITQSENISEDAFRSIALKLISGEAEGKKLVIRIPEDLERYFKHANLFRVVDIEVVEHLGNGKKGPSRESVISNIASGKFDVPELAAQSILPADDAMDDSFAMDDGAGLAAVEVAAPVAPKLKGFLVDAAKGTKFAINTQLTVGREKPADVTFEIPTISKRHFMIRQVPEGFLIEDLHSTNGTYLNGLPVHDAVPLRDGDEIVVAITLKHPKGAQAFQFVTKPA